MTGLENISLSLGGRRVLKTVSLAFAPGRLTAIIGPNGSGKTSLVKTLVRLLPPDAGRVLIDGRDVTALPPSQLSGRIAYLPQERQVHWPIRVRDLVMLGRLPHRRRFAMPDAADRAAVAAAMAACGLEGFGDRPLPALSGGEQARALLARALATGAPWIVADEPVASLDPYHQLGVMQVLKGEAGRGRGVIVVLHELSLASRFADHLVLMQEGEVAAEGAARDVLADERLAETFRIACERTPGGGVVPVAQR